MVDLMGFFLDWFQSLPKPELKREVEAPSPAPTPRLSTVKKAAEIPRAFVPTCEIPGVSTTAVELLSREQRLQTLFWQLNFLHFGGILPPVEMRFSGRLKTTGGQYRWRPDRIIQISTRYFENGISDWAQIEDTLGHEMVHYWLDFRGRPCGHTPEFTRKLKACGFSRYSGLIPPQTKIIYECPRCAREYYRKRAGVWSCGKCSGRKYNAVFQLQIKQRL